MQNKLSIFFVFLLSYSGAILHSIVPHHHHESQQEAIVHHHDHHHHSGSHSHDHKKNDKKGDKHDSSPYMLPHASTSDVIINHVAVDTSSKIKKVENPITSYSPATILNCASTQQVFHPPSDDFITDNSFFIFRALRAPPSVIA